MENSKMYHNQLTLKLCDKIGSGIGDKWRSFGRQLDFNDTELGHIDRDVQITKEKAMAVLSKWMRKIEDPKWGLLKKVLEDLELKDTILEIEEEFKQGIKT